MHMHTHTNTNRAATNASLGNTLQHAAPHFKSRQHAATHTNAHAQRPTHAFRHSTLVVDETEHANDKCILDAHHILRQRRIGCLMYTGHFPHKSPMMRGTCTHCNTLQHTVTHCNAFVERDLQLQEFYASSPPCSYKYAYTHTNMCKCIQIPTAYTLDNSTTQV